MLNILGAGKAAGACYGLYNSPRVLVVPFLELFSGICNRDSSGRETCHKVVQSRPQTCLDARDQDRSGRGNYIAISVYIRVKLYLHSEKSAPL